MGPNSTQLATSSDLVLASDFEVKAKIDAFIAQRRDKGNAGALGIPSEDVMQVDQDVQGSI